MHDKWKGYVFSPDGQAFEFAFDNYKLMRETLELKIAEGHAAGFLIPVPNPGELINGKEQTV